MAVKNPQITMALAVLLVVISQLGETIYLPATPAMTDALHTIPGMVQALLGIFLFSYGLCMFVWGPLSEYYGRRPIALISIVLYMGAALGCAWSTTIHQLWIWTFLMGMGMSTGGLLCRTMARDLYKGFALQKVMSVVSIALVITPLVAPVLGAQLLEWINWQANYYAIFGIGAITFVFVLWKMEESNPYVRQVPIQFSLIYHGYKAVLKEPRFIGNTACVSFNIASCFAYEAAAPFLFQDQLGVSAVLYSILCIVPVGGFLLGSYLSAALGQEIKRVHLIILAVFISLLCAVFMYSWEWCFGMSILSILIPITLYLGAAGILFPACTTGALMPFSRGAGLAGAMLGGIQNLISGFAVFFIGYLQIQNGFHLASMLFLLALACIPFILLCIYPYEKDGDGENE